MAETNQLFIKRIRFIKFYENLKFANYETKKVNYNKT